MGTDKNIKLHIVTDIKVTILNSLMGKIQVEKQTRVNRNTKTSLN